MTDYALTFISDTHNSLRKKELPEGDILFHSGDLTGRGTRIEVEEELRQLGKHRDKYAAIVLIAGNHDFLAQERPDLFRELCDKNGITYLQDEGANVQGLKVWGSPWTPQFFNWAFMFDRADAFAHKLYSSMPDDLDVLLTHGPALGIKDLVYRGEHVGCYDLLQALKVKKPKIHSFGHIHEEYGVDTTSLPDTVCINAAQLDDMYSWVHEPIEYRYTK